MVDSVTIDTSDENKGPSLEEEAAAQDAEAAKEGDGKLPSDGDQEGGQGDRPEWLPEKFKSPEDLAKAYAELEKTMGKGEDSGEDSGEDGEITEEQAQEAAEQAGLDLEALSAEYAENGELTDESYEALEKAGITREVVDQFIAGQEAQMAVVRSEILETVGGEEAYDSMLEWASDNLSDDEIDAFNDALDSGNISQIKLAVKGLSAQFAENVGQEPSRTLNGSTSNNSGLSTYRSTAELMKDMQDTRYAEDPAFRKQVEEKLGRSSIL